MEQEVYDYEDAILVARTVDGDAGAFDKLVAKYRSRLYATAFSVTKNEEDASDAVSDAILRAYRSTKSFRREARFSTWLHRIVVNCAKNLLKQTKRRNVVSLDQLGESIDERSVVPLDGKSDLDWRELMSQAQVYTSRELDHMPLEQKDLILSFHRDHVPYEQLAAKLNVPIGTVKSRMFRARRRLRSRVPSFSELAERCN